MKKKKRLIVHAPTLSTLSGGTSFIVGISGILSRNYELLLISKTGSQKVLNKIKDNKLSFFDNARFTSSFLIYWIFFPFSLMHEIVVTMLNIKRGDILLSFLFPSNFICSFISKYKKIDHFHYCFEPYPYLQNKKFANSFMSFNKFLVLVYSKIFSPLDFFGVTKAKKVFTLNEITKKMNKQIYGVDSVITLMGVDSTHFSPRKDAFNQKKYTGRKIVVHSTDYTTMKKTDLAIKSISILVKKHPELLLLITSTRPNAPEKATYVNLVSELNIKKNVEFLDLIDYEDLPILYSNALCYLSCSYDEMMGTTSSNLPVKESLACGTPAIRANITTEDVEDGVSGFLVDPRDVKLVAKKIDYLINNPEIAKKMGLAGRKKIVKLYKWENVAKTIIDTIEDQS